jgi:protein phosphatase
MKITISQPQAICELGHRSNQEDYIYPLQGQATAATRLFLLCDGMGGHEHGEVASQTVAQAMAGVLEPCLDGDTLADEHILQAVEQAYTHLECMDSDSLRKAGTTMTMLALHKGGATVAHIGDSRIYHFRPKDGTILYVSRDHSLVYELYQAGEISREEMATHPRKNIITRAIMPGADNRSRPDIMHTTDLKPGDYFMLCSDGILEHITDEELLALFASDRSDEEKCQRLKELTADNADNHSAYIIRIDAVEAEPGDEHLVCDEQTVRFNAVNIHPVRHDDIKAETEQPRRQGWLKRLMSRITR